MKLIGVEKRDNWLYSEWTLTYKTGWNGILKSASLIYHYMTDPEILTGDSGGGSAKEISCADAVLELEESGYLTIRGMSDILKVPVSITFLNQSDLVRCHVACMTEEFSEADYKEFNLSMCQFMDSAELAMYY